MVAVKDLPHNSPFWPEVCVNGQNSCSFRVYAYSKFLHKRVPIWVWCLQNEVLPGQTSYLSLFILIFAVYSIFSSLFAFSRKFPPFRPRIVETVGTQRERSFWLSHSIGAKFKITSFHRACSSTPFFYNTT